jgi:hypothetical protein
VGIAISAHNAGRVISNYAQINQSLVLLVMEATPR